MLCNNKAKLQVLVEEVKITLRYREMLGNTFPESYSISRCPLPTNITVPGSSTKLKGRNGVNRL